MLRVGLKAGTIMGIVAIVVVVIPLVALEIRPGALSGVADLATILLVLLMSLVLWFASGILAARFGAAAALTTGGAAGAGALAGAIGEIISQIAGVVMHFIFDFTFDYIPVSPIFSLIGGPGVTIAIAAGLGALGGIVGRAISARKAS